MNFTGKKVAVLGLGIEGKDAIQYLMSQGAAVTLLDKKPESELDFEGVDRSKIKVFGGENYLKNLDEFDVLVRSPGVYRYLPEIVAAEDSGVAVTSAYNIFLEKCPGKIVGVTGTKGKGTTSTLIYEILKADGRDAYLSGNIGKPYLSLLQTLTGSSWVVMETSSFQLIDAKLSPHVAVVLNITLDHMDWHKDREEYIDAKKNIVFHQTDKDFAVINDEYETPKSFANFTKANVVLFSKQKLEKPYKEELLLRGEHNLENIAAAVAVAKTLGVQEEIILNTVRSFKGLEHRLELVSEVNGVAFYNDSFATGPQPTIAAINSFSEPETIILGGSDKGLDYKELIDLIKDRQNVKNVILIGDVGQKLFGSLQEESFKDKQIINLKYSKMTDIVKRAFEVTPKGGVVILSPAAASFDMFKNYKDRGNQFKAAVGSLLQK